MSKHSFSLVVLYVTHAIAFLPFQVFISILCAKNFALESTVGQK